MRLLGVILLLIGFVLMITIVLAPIGFWFMLFGVLLALLGGSRRVVVRYDRERSRSPAADFFARRRDDKKQRLEQQKGPRADAADDFNGAVLLYQKHHGHQDAGSAIRVLATEALREKGFLR